MNPDPKDDRTSPAEDPNQTDETKTEATPAKSGWRGVLAKVIPTKKAAKDKPSPNIYPLF